MYIKVNKECFDGLDAGSDVLTDMCRLKSLLEPRNTKIGRNMVVAGSAALRGLRFQETMEEENWVPGDIDIYVYGKHARSSYVRSIVNKFVVRCAEQHTPVRFIEETWSWYCFPDYKVLIQNVTVEGFKCKLSFIQFPFANSSFDVINSFDINIVRVCFYIYSQEFFVSQSDWHCIEEKQARLSPIEWRQALPNGRDVRRLNAVIGRMNKYSKRGYSFDSAPLLTILDKDGTSIGDADVCFGDLREYEFESEVEDSDYSDSGREDSSTDEGDGGDWDSDGTVSSCSSGNSGCKKRQRCTHGVDDCEVLVLDTTNGSMYESPGDYLMRTIEEEGEQTDGSSSA